MIVDLFRITGFQFGEPFNCQSVIVLAWHFWLVGIDNDEGNLQ